MSNKRYQYNSKFFLFSLKRPLRRSLLRFVTGSLSVYIVFLVCLAHATAEVPQLYVPNKNCPNEELFFNKQAIIALPPGCVLQSQFYFFSLLPKTMPKLTAVNRIHAPLIHLKKAKID